MPYNIKKYKTGYNNLKKSKIVIESQINTKEVGSNLYYKSTVEDFAKKTVVVTYKVKSEINTSLRVVYSLGKDIITTDYLYYQTIDHNDPMGEPITFVDPETPESKKRLAIYDLTSEDVIMAGHDGYDKIEETIFNSQDLRDPYEEGLEFDKMYYKILTIENKYL